MASWWIVEQEGLGGGGPFSRAFGRYLRLLPATGPEARALEVPSWWVDAYELARRFTWTEANQVVHELRAVIAAHLLPAHRAVGLVPLRDVRVRAVEVDASTRALLDLATVE